MTAAFLCLKMLLYLSHFFIYCNLTQCPLQESAQFGKMSVDEKGEGDAINVKDEKEICGRTIELTSHLLEGSSDKVKKLEAKSQGKKGVDKELLQACY